jgi:ABC-type transporter Mla MlaB component
LLKSGGGVVNTICSLFNLPCNPQESHQQSVILSLFKKDRSGKGAGTERPGDQGSSRASTPASNAGVSTGASGMPKEFADIAEIQTDFPQMPIDSKSNSPESAFAPRMNAPMSVDPKALARAAVAKIDAIESEMVEKYTGKKSPNVAAAKVEGGPKVVGGLPQNALKPVQRSSRPGSMPGQPDLENPSDMLLGDSSLRDAMEIASSSTAAAIEEAAVLYANGQTEAATEVLLAAIRDGSLGRSEYSGYHMLFDLLHLQGKKEEYDQHSLDFVVKFEQSPPGWTQRVAPRPPAVSQGNMPQVTFKAALDASIVPQLERIKQLAAKHTALRLEFSQVKTADVVGCELLMRVLNAFAKAHHQMDMTGTDKLLAAVSGLIEKGRKDPSQAAWLLLLELHRIADRQEEFENLAIDYCVTYEVSPPSWEPAPKNIRSSDPAPLTANTIVDNLLPDEITATGEIKGLGESLIAQIDAALAMRSTVSVNCKSLDRIEFGAAGNLLANLSRWAGQGKAVDFRHLNHLIAGLFVTLGIHQLAGVERRKSG